MTIKHTYRVILTTALAVCALFAYSFSGAAWTNPPNTPPNNNVPAPINVGDHAQVKTGNFGANILATAPTEEGAVWSNEYCDANGENCIKQENLTSDMSNNQMVYLDLPVVITPDTEHPHRIKITDAGFPSNTTEVFISVSTNSSNSRVTSHHSGRYLTALDSQDITNQTFRWVPVKSSLSMRVNNSNSQSSYIQAEVAAYKCNGKCLETNFASSCSVEFTTWIAGEEVRVTRNIPAPGRIYVAMEYVGRPGNSHLGFYNDFEELIHHRSWNKGWYSGEYGPQQAWLGYVTHETYEKWSSILPGDDSGKRSRGKAGRLDLTTGSYVRILNDPNRNMDSNQVGLIGEVISCR